MEQNARDALKLSNRGYVLAAGQNRLEDRGDSPLNTPMHCGGLPRVASQSIASIAGFVVPHAAYQYSGSVAAHAFHRMGAGVNHRPDSGGNHFPH